MPALAGVSPTSVMKETPIAQTLSAPSHLPAAALARTHPQPFNPDRTTRSQTIFAIRSGSTQTSRNALSPMPCPLWLCCRSHKFRLSIDAYVDQSL